MNIPWAIVAVVCDDGMLMSAAHGVPRCVGSDAPVTARSRPLSLYPQRPTQVKARRRRDLGRMEEDNMTACRGIRGATTAEANEREAILSTTRDLLARLMERNRLLVDDITAVFFTVTDDLDAEYPALAARQLGWTDAALLCAREIPVQGASVARCVRVLLLVNTDLSASQITHVYLREAVALRPSRADAGAPSAPEGWSDAG